MCSTLFSFEKNKKELETTRMGYYRLILIYVCTGFYKTCFLLDTTVWILFSFTFKAIFYCDFPVYIRVRRNVMYIIHFQKIMWIFHHPELRINQGSLPRILYINKLEMNFKPNKHEFNKILRREICIGRKVLNRSYKSGLESREKF